MRRDLRPATHVVPPPAGGWTAADLDDDELVNDQHITDDPTSYLIPADQPAQEVTDGGA